LYRATSSTKAVTATQAQETVAPISGVAMAGLPSHQATKTVVAAVGWRAIRPAGRGRDKQYCAAIAPIRNLVIRPNVELLGHDLLLLVAKMQEGAAQGLFCGRLDQDVHAPLLAQGR
jgi:hypothetical protein